MNDNFDWTDGIVAIYGDKSQPAGTGFVVSADGLIATCAHVLDQAGWPYEAWDAPVQIRFKASGRYAEAFVQQACFKGQTEGDLAILALKDRLPDGAEVLRLTAARAAIGHKVATWGYPKFRATGLGGSGEVVNLIPGDWGELIQFDSANTTRGYSGGPV
jgi:S1-C subfamily serine protease